MFYAILCATLFSALWLWRLRRRPQGVPPGPCGIPLFGSLLSLGRESFLVLNEMSKTYGNVFSIFMGSRLVVILNDYSSIRRAFVEMGEVFSGRPHEFREKFFEPKRRDKDIIFTDNEVWRENRRFSISTLKSLGVGKSSLELGIQDEISNFLQVIADKKETPFEIKNLLSTSICNNVCVLITGRRFEYDDPLFLKSLEAIEIATNSTAMLGLDIFMPWIKWIPGIKRFMGDEELDRSFHLQSSFFDKIIDEHKKLYREGMKDDFIYSYLAERSSRTDGTASLFDDSILNEVLPNLQGAGTETAVTTLRWSLLFMLLHPEIQTKVQKEIDDVVGRQRLPSWDDRTRMVYTEATLLEIQRRASIVPLGVPHRCRKTVEFESFVIPQDTMVFPNLWSVHHDEKLFPDPFTFDPNRFINVSTGEFEHSPHVIPFSIGKRYCLGEPLARMELFLYFTSMLQRFRITNPEGQIASLRATFGITRSPDPFLVRFVPRDTEE